MFGAIVLRDIPKQEVRIDVVTYPIEGGFRGFGMVPPAAWHYVSVKARTHHVGFWCYLQPKQAIVKIFDYETQQFEDADPDTQAQYADMALSGAMGPALKAYPETNFGAWYGLVRHIPRENFPPQLHVEDSGSGSRFHKALHGTHGGDKAAFLAEFQYAFVSWYVSLPSAAPDEAAFERWRALVLAAYNAGEDAIRESGELFSELIECMLRQFAVMGDKWFAADSFIVSSQANYMVEDMMDCGVPEIAEKGAAFRAYIQKRSSSKVLKFNHHNLAWFELV